MKSCASSAPLAPDPLALAAASGMMAVTSRHPARQVSMTADELIALNEQIAGMAKAGLPLDQGLASLAREMRHGRLRSVTAAIAADLHAGVPLAEAVEHRRGEMPPFYAHLVTAGI